MSQRILWGFGSTIFGLDSLNTVKFNYAQTQIRFIPVYNRFETISRQIRTVLKGYRPQFTITLVNIMDGDWDKWKKLLQYINISNADNIPLYISPRNDNYTTWEAARKYAVVLDSDINNQDIGNGAAQNLELVFTGTDLLPVLPTYLTSAVVYNMVDQLDNQYVDEDGNPYTFND